MRNVRLSVIVPTHNRHASLSKTLERLRYQDIHREHYEIVVVDDGSTPPLALSPNDQGPACSVVRLEGAERSAARNRGADAARGEVLVFLDDDMTVGPDFLSAHLRGHEEWQGTLVVGAVRLIEEAIATPFGRFRQNIEQQNVPRSRGLTSIPNFCTAANMSIPRNVFVDAGGFDESLASAEDQDLALRHTARGGQIAFIPEAVAIHNDDSLDIRSYCRRVEWGMENMVPFCRRHPDWPDNVARDRVNGVVRISREPLSQSGRKLIKFALRLRPADETLFGAAWVLEHVAANSGMLDRVYRVLLGTHIFKGYRRGLKRFGDLYKQETKTISKLPRSSVASSKS
jgi:GT2 family glycosyltransferase